MSNVLAPIPEPFSPEIAEILAQYPQRDGYILALFRTFANSVRFLRKGVPNLLDKRSPLSIRQREIVILRVTARTDCEYEWGVHAAAFGERIGLTREQIVATRAGRHDSPCWSTEDSLLIRAVDDVCDHAIVSEAILQEFQRAWTVEQQLEILALCGAYHTVSFVANTARLAREPFAERFPSQVTPQAR
ncbi:MAG: carboxymuconolactone decarboxylase family protein [Steroidobacter sp.]